MAHAEIHGTGQRRDAAVGLEDDAAELLRRRRGDFQEAADAEAPQLAALAAFALAMIEAFVIGRLDRFLQYGGEITAVVGRPGRRLRRHVTGADVVPAAQ